MSRDQRRWIDALAQTREYDFGFGSDNEMRNRPSYLIIKHDLARRLISPAIRRSLAVLYLMREVIGCLGEDACVSAGLDRQHSRNELWVAERAGRERGFLPRQPDRRLPFQSTGKAGVSSHHLGGDLVWQVGDRLLPDVWT